MGRMSSTFIATRYCCVDCSGHRVERLDWISVNAEEFIGGDPGDDYWCPDCETHPSRAEEREVTFQLCAACSKHAWGSGVPLPGIRLAAASGTIERCQDCAVYESDLDAARALGAEIRRRGGGGTVRFVVEGVG